MCDLCDWDETLDRIDELLNDDSLEWASDTLNGIRDWVEDNEHVTPGQSNAVENIAEKSKN
jgi:hypothetical protein